MTRLLRLLSLQREQIRDLHQENRELAVRCIAQERRAVDLEEENRALRADLLDHHYHCIKGESVS